MLDEVKKSEHIGLRIVRHAGLGLVGWDNYYDSPTVDSLATTILSIAAQAIIDEKEPDYKTFLESGQIESFKEYWNDKYEDEEIADARNNHGQGA